MYPESSLHIASNQHDLPVGQNITHNPNITLRSTQGGRDRNLSLRDGLNLTKRGGVGPENPLKN